MKLMIALLALVVTGCNGGMTKPNIPEKVTVVVTEYKPLPSWATEPLNLPYLFDGTVKSHLQRENACMIQLELANCHRTLLRKIDKDEPANLSDCEIK